MGDLQLVNIVKTYETAKTDRNQGFSLKSIDLTIKEGEFFSLLGPSGCGKTTILKLVAGLLTPSKGDLYLGTKKITQRLPEDRGFSMVFQQVLLFPHMTIEENVAFGLKMQGIPKKKRIEKAQNMLISVGLKGYSSRYPHSLSGGQQQRVALARALVTEPRLLLMDEPFSALDPELREEMRELVSQLQKQFRVTVLFVTHDRDEAFQLSDRIGVMKEGGILQVGTPIELYEHPASPDVALFLGAKNVISGKIKNGLFYSDEFKLNVTGMKNIGDAEGWLVIRPEILKSIKENEAIQRDDLKEIRGIVKQVSFRQGFYYVKVEIGSKCLEAVFNVEESLDLEFGDFIRFVYNPKQLYFIPYSN